MVPPALAAPPLRDVVPVVALAAPPAVARPDVAPPDVAPLEPAVVDAPPVVAFARELELFDAPPLELALKVVLADLPPTPVLVETPLWLDLAPVPPLGALVLLLFAELEESLAASPPVAALLLEPWRVAPPRVVSPEPVASAPPESNPVPGAAASELDDVPLRSTLQANRRGANRLMRAKQGRRR